MVSVYCPEGSDRHCAKFKWVLMFLATIPGICIIIALSTIGNCSNAFFKPRLIDFYRKAQIDFC